LAAGFLGYSFYKKCSYGSVKHQKTVGNISKLPRPLAIQDILHNCVYARLITVPAFKEVPEKYVKAIHEPIISEPNIGLFKKC